MIKSQGLVFYNDFGKFRRLSLECVFCENQSEGTNGNLPFFICSFSAHLPIIGRFLPQDIYFNCLSNRN